MGASGRWPRWPMTCRSLQHAALPRIRNVLEEWTALRCWKLRALVIMGFEWILSILYWWTKRYSWGVMGMFPWKYRGNVMGEYHQQYVTMFFWMNLIVTSGRGGVLEWWFIDIYIYMNIWIYIYEYIYRYKYISIGHFPIGALATQKSMPW